MSDILFNLAMYGAIGLATMMVILCIVAPSVTQKVIVGGVWKDFAKAHGFAYDAWDIHGFHAGQGFRIRREGTGSSRRVVIRVQPPDNAPLGLRMTRRRPTFFERTQDPREFLVGNHLDRLYVFAAEEHESAKKWVRDLRPEAVEGLVRMHQTYFKPQVTQGYLEVTLELETFHLHRPFDDIVEALNRLIWVSCQISNMPWSPIHREPVRNPFSRNDSHPNPETSCENVILDLDSPDNETSVPEVEEVYDGRWW